MHAPDAINPAMVGAYTLGPLVGRGAMSEVYTASHPVHGDRIAVKLLRDASTEAAFLAEAAQTRGVHHRNVVRILDAGRDRASGRCYLVMDLVDGEDLATRLRRCTRLDEAATRTLFAAIADGMAAVHAAGLVHRDLKPANVMLSGDEPRIVDFGIAKALGEHSAVATGRRIGTPAFMAPEQLTGGLIAPCVDVWALGVMMFEAITGVLPFDGFTDGRCPQLFETAPRASARCTVSPLLDRLIARCLDRDPGRRPRSMEAIARELRGEIDVEEERVTQDAGLLPVVAAPPTKQRRGIPLIIGGAAVVVIAVSLIIAGRSGDANEPPPVRAENIALPPAPQPAPVAEPVRPASGLVVEVRSRPSGAQIVIDGQARGVTPARLDLAGPTAIVVRRAGYQSARVRADREGPIDVDLVPVVRKRPRETLD